MDKELLKYASCKKLNRRLELTIWKTDDGVAVVIYTKRLLDKKKRHILESKVTYGVETFALLRDLLLLIWDDPEFLKTVNPELGLLYKAKWGINTNINH
jgi:hypothetical protein